MQISLARGAGHHVDDGRQRVNNVTTFGIALLIAAAVIALALASNRVSARLPVPAPAMFLVAAALASDFLPALGQTPLYVVEDIVTVALVVILFDGGMKLGERRMRRVLGPVLATGVLGTVLVAAALGALAHVVLGLPWLPALLLAAALAPTDPAVVFSVLANREIVGRAGSVLEGESGVNDPVGIALVFGLLAFTPDSGFGTAAGAIGTTFVLQLGVGVVVGLAGGWLLRWAMRRLPLPSEGLYPLRTLAISVAVYGAATAAHGSGFLAVFVAGLMVGDVSAPYKAEIARFHSSLASLAEIIAFVVLGLTVSLTATVTSAAWWMGLVLAALLTVVVRPLLIVPLLMATARMLPGEHAFVAWAGLKGAVPILLGTYVVDAAMPSGPLLYQIIFVVVLFSVLLQGGLLPRVARCCGVRLRVAEPRPWPLGIRLREQPRGVHRFRVADGADAVGRPVRELHQRDNVWISLLVRDGRPVRVRPDTLIQPGDEVLLLVDPGADGDPGRAFAAP